MTVADIIHLPNDQAVADIAVEDGGEVLAGVMAEYDNVDDVYAAAERVRDAGYSRWDVHSPFPIHGIERAMDIRPTSPARGSASAAAWPGCSAGCS